MALQIFYNWFMNENTLLNHPPEIVIIEGNRPLLSPVYHSAKFTMSDQHSYGEQFVYGRVSNPTTRQLELTLAQIQGKEDCIVLSSGIGALTSTFLSLLKSGDHMITFRELYKPARMFIRDFLPKYGITSSILSLEEMDKLEQAIRPETKLIHFESPTNPNLDIADIEAIVKVARKHNVLVSMDGTFAGLHQHRQYDIDVMIQSLTKFGNGHGDVIAGSIAGKTQLMNKIRETTLYIGAHLDPQATYLIQRGLKTYMLRYERQTATAQKVAEYLSTHPNVVSVRYPGLKSHKSYKLAHEQMKDMGAVVSFEIKKDVVGSAEKFCHKLELIQLAASIGSTESIIAPTLTFFGLDLRPEEREKMGINTHSVRLSIGLEDVQDIINDLDKALTP